MISCIFAEEAIGFHYHSNNMHAIFQILELQLKGIGDVLFDG